MLLNRLAAIAIAVTLATTLAGCGDDTPTAPRTSGNNTPPPAVTDVTVSISKLDYGVVCFGSDKTLSLTIKAGDDNTEDATGIVELDRATDNSYNIASGGGEYTLAPGETRKIEVRYNPQEIYRAHDGALSVFVDGVGDNTVDLTGYSSARPYLEFAPGGGIGPGYDTNYRHFITRVPVVTIDTNVDYADPSWLRCNGPTWIFNGNSITESGIGFEIDVPSGTSKVTVALEMEAEGDCTQLLIEIDGSEHRWENLGGRCQDITKTLNITSGKHTIRIGTDQSAFCGDDLAIWDVRLEFNRACLSENER